MPTPHRIIAVVNQKGGVGKTAVSANLAAAIAQCGGEALVIDSDRQGNVTTQLLPDGAELGLDDVYAGTASLQDAITRSTSVGVDAIAAGPQLEKAELGMVGLLKRESILTRHLATLDVDATVIIDCPPNLGLLAVNALAACTEVLIPVSMQDSESITGLAHVMTTLGELFSGEKQPPLHAVINRVIKGRTVAKRLSDGLEAYKIPMAAARIPERAIFHDAPDNGLPAIVTHPDSVPAMRFRELVHELEIV